METLKFKFGDKVRCIMTGWGWERIGLIVTVKFQDDDDTFKCIERDEWISNRRYVIDEGSIVDQVLNKYLNE